MDGDRDLALDDFLAIARRCTVTKLLAHGHACIFIDIGLVKKIWFVLLANLSRNLLSSVLVAGVAARL